MSMVSPSLGSKPILSVYRTSGSCYVTSMPCMRSLPPSPRPHCPAPWVWTRVPCPTSCASWVYRNLHGVMVGGDSLKTKNPGPVAASLCLESQEPHKLHCCRDSLLRNRLGGRSGVSSGLTCEALSSGTRAVRIREDRDNSGAFADE
jgi:hypothetical protein